MKINTGVVVRLFAIMLLLTLACYFSNLVLYIFVAFIFSLIGKPIAKKMSSIRIYKYCIPYGISALLTMMLFILFLVLILLFFVPMLTHEAKAIAGIDYDELSVHLSYLLDHVQDFLYNNNLIDEHETLVGLVTNEIRDFASLTNFSAILGGVVSTTGSFLMGLFAILFLTFFFMKDDIRLDRMLQPLIGEQHAIKLTVVSGKINRLLSRYYIGLLIEICSMITLLYISLAVFGIRSAFLMAVLGGLLNAIPYLGPLIGGIIACLFSIANCLSIGDYQSILPTLLEIAGAFLVANLTDNLVLQPLIYSKSVKTHPVEIFLVVIMGGTFAGVLGMLFAIPVYTMIRTIMIELFHYVNTKQTNNCSSNI